MDINLYLRVLWRWRTVVVLGLVLATALAALSLVRVSWSGGSVEAKYRGQEQWASAATVFVTQAGFPLGRSIYDEAVPVQPAGKDPNGQSYVPRFADPSRFSSYAQLYARLASSDLLKRQMALDGPLKGSVSADAATDARNPGIALPLVEIQGLAATARDAQELAGRATKALVSYVEREQTANAIAPSRRVILRVLNEPSPPIVVTPRSKTRPVFVFVAVMMAFAALIFVLQNLRPQKVAAKDDAPDSAVSSDARRLA